MKSSLIDEIDKQVKDLYESPYDSKLIESRIDFLVYHLYGLAYDEVLVIDPQPPFTREEYEKEN